jgi:hypothetical protein
MCKIYIKPAEGSPYTEKTSTLTCTLNELRRSMMQAMYR